MSYRRFEPPLVKPLYITLHRAADILEIPYHRMQALSFRLGRVYFGPGGGAPRVLLSKVEELKAYADAQAQPPEAPEPSIATEADARRDRAIRDWGWGRRLTTRPRQPTGW